jgi:SAM-dependent methyltransferase
MNPQYSDSYLQRYYAHYYDESHSAGERLRAADPAADTRQVAAKRARLERLGRYVTPGRLLCIGCGNGLELLLARDMGWRPEGFDVDPQYMDDLQAQLDLPLYCGRLDDLGLPAARYDAIFMDQVLEHPKRPQDYLREAHRLLRPGGVLLVACPNLGSLANRTKTWLGRLRLKRRRGKHYDLFHHLFLYRAKTLAGIMRQRFDFEILAVQGDPDGGRRDRRRSWLDPWRRRLPMLESSFCLLARKPVPMGSGPD